jgi:hypothetical protein
MPIQTPNLLLWTVKSFGLIGKQLPEKYKENFDVSSEGPSSEVSTWPFQLMKDWRSFYWITSGRKAFARNIAFLLYLYQSEANLLCVESSHLAEKNFSSQTILTHASNNQGSANWATRSISTALPGFLWIRFQPQPSKLFSLPGADKLRENHLKYISTPE